MAENKIQHIESFPEGFAKYRQTFNVSSGSTKTVALDFDYGNRLLITTHTSSAGYNGIYVLLANGVGSVVPSSTMTVTMSSGTVSIKNNGSNTCTCLII